MYGERNGLGLGLMQIRGEQEPTHNSLMGGFKETRLRWGCPGPFN
jgi:hypothetical protein